jgi:hypothetical protein
MKKAERRSKHRPARDRRELPRPNSKLRKIEDIAHETVREYSKENK